MIDKIIIKKSEKVGYFPDNNYKTSLGNLSDFLLDIGAGRENEFKVEWILDLETEGGGFNSTCFEKKGEHIHINYDLPSMSVEEDFIIDKKNLAEILKKWIKLTESGAEIITLTKKDDGTVIIQGK